MDQKSSNPAGGQPLSPQEKKKLSDMAKFFARAVSQAHDFGINHPLAKQPIEDAFNIISSVIQERGRLPIYIAEKKLHYSDNTLEEKNPVVDKLISLLTAVKVVSFEFETGFNREDFLALLAVLALRPQDIVDAGGIDKLFEEKNILHIKLNPIKYELIGMDEKVVSGGKLSDDDLRELDKIFAKVEGQGEGGGEEIKKEQEDAPEQERLLYLIDPSLKEDAGQAVFVEKLVHNPLDEVHSIVDTVRLVNKVGGERARTILSSLNKKLELVRDDLYQCLLEGKEDNNTKDTYKSAAVLGKELGRQLKSVEVSADLTPTLEEMNNIVTMVLDQTEAHKMLSLFLKGEMTLKKKVSFLKSLMQRTKVSPDFEFMVQKVLVLKGIPESEVKSLLEQKSAILDEFEKEQETEGIKEIKPVLAKLSEKQLSLEDVTEELNKIIERSVEIEAKQAVKKIELEKEQLEEKINIFNDAFGGIDEGVAIFDGKGRVIFMNGKAAEILTPGSDGQIDQALVNLFAFWEPAGDIEKFLINSQTGPVKTEQFRNILSKVRNIKKNPKNQPEIVIFKALS